MEASRPATQATRVLVIEDDESTRALLRKLLERTDKEVVEATTGSAGIRTLYSDRPELVLLDVGLPDMSGWQVLERIRESTDLPVMMVTGEAFEVDKVRAFRMGADDYLTKPFGIQEVTARVDALLRRPQPGRELPPNYADQLVEVDAQAATARAGGRLLDLTPLEYRLLRAFTAHPRQVLAPGQLLEIVWGENFGTERVKLYVGYLRAKFRAVGAEAPITTVRGFGYRYDPPGEV